MKISFCMPAYNKELYLNDAITSILGQDYKDIELVIVDDKSEDGTQDICEHYVSLYPDKIKYIRNKKNMGVGYCRNLAWLHATGDIICVNDADDLSIMHRAKIVADAFTNNKNLDILYGSCIAINHRNENIGHRVAEEFNVSRIKNENYIQHPTVSYKRSIPVRYREVRYIDDWYFYMDCIDAGLKFGKVKEVLGVYRVIHDGLTQDKGFYNKEKDKAKQALKDEFKNFQEDISHKLKTNAGQRVRVKAILNEIPRSSSVLDIGCNGGYIMEQIKKNGGLVEGIEHSEYLVNKCKAKGLKVWQDDVLTLKNTSAKQYDIILLCDILEHYQIENVVGILNRVLERLKKHGKVVITVPYKYGRYAKRYNADHVYDYDVEDFDMILSISCKMKIKPIFVDGNAVPDWLLVTGEI